MGSMIFLSRRAKNTKLRVTLTSSAMTKDHHTIIHVAGLTQQPGGGQQDHQLAADRDDQAEHTVAQRLEGGGQDDAHAGQQEVEADDAQGRLADGQHGLAGGEQAQQLVGQELEQQEADQHDGLCIEHGAA